MTYNLTIFLTSYSFMHPPPHPPDISGPLTQRKPAAMAFQESRASLLTAPRLLDVNGVRLRWLPDVFSARRAKCRGRGRLSHNEKDSHLNIIIKDNFKCSNDAELVKTSCNDERACR